MKNAYFSSLN